MTREEAYNRIDAIIARHEIDDEYVTITSFLDYDALRIARKILEQEPKTGYWIALDKCSNSGYYCSRCRKKVVKEGWSDSVKRIKFCPNCGAMMIKSEDKK